LQGLRSANREGLFVEALLITKFNPAEPGITTLFEFIQLIADDKNHEERVIKAAVGLIGDIAHIIGSNDTVRQQLQYKTKAITEIIQLALDKEAHTSTREAAMYAVNKLQSLGFQLGPLTPQ